MWTWALASVVAHTLAVLAVLVFTGFVKDGLSMPVSLTFILAFFIGSLISTLKISYAHSGFGATSGEVVSYNLALVFQGFGLASVLANSLTCASAKGGI